MPNPEDRSRHTRCSFCGSGRAEARHLIAGPGVYICDRCLETAEAESPQVSEPEPGRHIRCSFCGKGQAAVTFLLVAGGTRICEECAKLARDRIQRIELESTELAMPAPERVSQPEVYPDGTVLEPLPTDFEPHISAIGAWKTMRTATRGASSARLLLALYTGTLREMLPDGGRSPTHDRVPAWVAIIRDARTPVIGPFQAGGYHGPHTVVSTRIEALDARSGELVEGSGFQPDD